MGISSIGAAQRQGPERMDRTQTAAPDAEFAPGAPGKSADSVGHRAKAAIAAADNADLPPNIQGQVASAIARNLDFTALLAAEAPAGEGEEPALPVDEATPPAEETALPVDEAVPPADELVAPVADLQPAEAVIDPVTELLLDEVQDEET